jgi:hypothetical protein
MGAFEVIRPMPLALRCKFDGAALFCVSSPGFGELAACPRCGAAAPYRSTSEERSGLITAYLGAELAGRLREDIGLAA